MRKTLIVAALIASQVATASDADVLASASCERRTSLLEDVPFHVVVVALNRCGPLHFEVIGALRDEPRMLALKLSEHEELVAFLQKEPGLKITRDGSRVTIEQR